MAPFRHMRQMQLSKTVTRYNTQLQLAVGI